jgi:hypothetical protein
MKLLDMTPLKNQLNALLDNEQGSASGFITLLHCSINRYHDFGTIGTTLAMAATSMNKSKRR